MATARYRVGQKLRLSHSPAAGGEPVICDATITRIWQPGQKRNTHMHLISVHAPAGDVEEFCETANLTHWIRHTESINTPNGETRR
jgi:hypothetical protein